MSQLISVRPRGSGDPGATSSDLSKFWVPASAGTNGIRMRFELSSSRSSLSRRDVPLLPGLSEIAQIRCCLALPGRHQIAIGADVVVLLADDDMLVVLVAAGFDPAWRLLATVGLVDRVRTGQGVVDRRDVVTNEARIGLVEVNPLVNDGLVVRV